MSDEQAAEMLALAEGARPGATPLDTYGTTWGQVLSGVDPVALVVSGEPSIEIPADMPEAA